VALEDMLADACRRLVVHEIDRDPAGPLGADRGGERGQSLLATSHQYERGGGLARETAGGRLSDSARGARDEHHERLTWGVCGFDDEVRAVDRSVRRS